MAYKQGVSDFVRVAGQGADPNVVYAIGVGGKPLSSETELAQYSGGAITSGGKVRTISPDEAKSLGVIDFLKAPVNGIDNTGSTLSQATAEQQIKDLQTQYEQSQTESKGLKDKITGLISEKETIAPIDTQKVFNNALAQYGFTPETFATMNQAVTNLGELNKKIAALDTEEQTALMNNDNRQTSMNFIEGEGAKISRAYAIKKSGIAAQASAVSTQLEALRGNLTQAQQLAGQAVQNLTYDRQQKVDDLKWSFDTYSSLYNEMEKKEQDAWTNLYNMNVKDLETKKADYTAILNLMIQAPTAQWPTDISKLSLADATAIAQAGLAKQQTLNANKTSIVGSADTGYYSVTVDATGKVINKTLIVGGTGGSGGKDLARQTAIDSFIASKKGTDGLISADDYVQAQKKWVGMGGTVSDFKASYAVEKLMGNWEYNKLPASMQPTQITPTNKLPEEQVGLINDAKAAWDTAKQQFKATPELRNAIIERAKQYGFDLSPYF